MRMGLSAVVIAVATLSAQPLHAVLSEAPLVNTNQVLAPDGSFPSVLGAVNFRYTNQGLLAGPGTVNGVGFQTFNWLNGPQLLASGATLSVAHSAGDGTFRARAQNTAGTISGANDNVLESIANTINFYEGGATGTFTLSNLPANRAVKVQFIGGDDGSFFNNWNGDLVLVANGVGVGTWNAGDDGNNQSAKIVTFDATTNGAGQLVITANQPIGGQHAGIGGLVVLGAPGAAAAAPAFGQADLTSTTQILGPDSAFDAVRAAVNFKYSNQAASVAGSVNGITFQDVDWLAAGGAPQPLAGGATVQVVPTFPLTGGADGTFRARFQNTASTITGPGDAVLESVANTINFMGAGESEQINFAGLPANRLMRIQIIGGDDGAGLGNWLGDFDIQVNGVSIGLWNIVADDTNPTASLATLLGTTTAAGTLSLNIRQVNGPPGQFAGIAGVILTQAQIPEPTSLSLLGLGALALIRRRRVA